MAKMYYSLEETIDRLGCTEGELRAMIRSGKLREFRDAGKLNYRIDEVQKLAAEREGGVSDASGELEIADDTGAGISLSSLGSGSLSLDDSGGGSSLGLADSGGGLNLGGTDAPIKLAGSGNDLNLETNGLNELNLGESPTASGLKLGGSGAGSGSPPTLEDSGAGPDDELSLAGSGIGSGLPTLEDSGSGAPAEDVSAGSGSALGEDIVSLEEVDKEVAEGMKKDDTVITNIGISVFDDEDLEIAADPMAKTLMAGGDEDLRLDGSGGGSGLLDLTRESDDTSLGAELLEGIDMGDTADTVSPTVTEAEPVVTDDEGLPEPSLEPALAGIPVQFGGVIEPVSPAFTGLLVAATLVLGLAGALNIAMSIDAWPGYLAALAEQVWFVLIGSIAMGGLFAGIGWFVGKQATAPKKPKVKKEPQAKKTKAKGKGKKQEAADDEPDVELG